MIKISRPITTMLIFGYAFLFVPILFLIVNAFSDSDIPSIWTKFSLRWFNEIFEDDDLMRALITSLKIASIAASGALVLGTAVAVLTTGVDKFRGKRFLKTTILMPIVMPEIICGFALLMLFMSMSSIWDFPKARGVTSVALGHIIASISFVNMSVRARLQTCDRSVEDAALNLGARPIVVFFRIKIPMIFNAMIAGWLLAFTLSLDDLVISSFLSGPGTTTLSIIIFSNIRIGLTPSINALATIFILLTLLLISLMFILNRQNAKN